MQAISELRFNSLAGCSRSPTLALIARNLAWYEEENSRRRSLARQIGTFSLQRPPEVFDFIVGQCHRAISSYSR
jgi:hypothetical protein